MSEEILKDLRAVAAVLGVDVLALTRDDYMQVDTKRFSRRKVRAVFGVWKNATRAAAGIEVEAAPMEAVPTGFHVRRVSTLSDPDGKVKQQWTISEREREDREAMLRRLLEELPTTIPVREGSITAPEQGLSGALLAIYPMGDPHIGMYSSEGETGLQWGLAENIDLHKRAIDSLTVGTEASRALLINLGDFFHSDGPGNSTVKGTPVDVDGRWWEVYRAGMELKVYMIDRALASHDSVEVWTRCGNHDGGIATMMALGLSLNYKDEERVTIHVNPAAADYMEHGECLIGATHGDAHKEKDLESIMAADQPAAWGRTTQRLWFVGHLHHRIVKEYRGCTVETFRTLSPKDAWHANAGYRSGRDMCRITLHKQWGEVGRLTRSAGYLMAAA